MFEINEHTFIRKDAIRLKNRFIGDFVLPISRFLALLIMYLVGIMILVSLVSAQNITYETSDTAIIWNYSEIDGVINASVDGVIIKDFNPYIGIYAISGLEKNETHIFTVYNGEFFSSIAKTENPKSEQEKSFEFVNTYLFFILALICLIISAWEKLAALLSLLFSLLGIITSINDNFIMGIVFVTMTLVSIGSLGYDA